MEINFSKMFLEIKENQELKKYIQNIFESTEWEKEQKFKWAYVAFSPKERNTIKEIDDELKNLILVEPLSVSQIYDDIKANTFENFLNLTIQAEYKKAIHFILQHTYKGQKIIDCLISGEQDYIYTLIERGNAEIFMLRKRLSEIQSKWSYLKF